MKLQTGFVSIENTTAYPKRNRRSGSVFPSRHKRWNAFPWPVVCAVIYLLMGFLENLWHLGRIVFITIPVYYWICSFFKRK